MKRHSRAAVVSAIACFALATGCDRLAKLRRGKNDGDAGSAAPTVLSRPPTPDVRANEIRFRETKATVSLLLQGTSYGVSFFDFPPSSKVVVGDVALTTNPEGFVQTKVDLAERMARVSPQDAFDAAYRLDPQKKLALDFGPTANLVVDLPGPSLKQALTDAYKKVPTTPLVLDAGPPPRAHTVCFVGLANPEVIGPAKTLAEVDWVATVETLPPRPGRSCGGYREMYASSDSPTSTLTVQRHAQKVSVYEVKTGKRVTEKVFEAPNKCPEAALKGRLESYVSPDDQRSWLRKLVGARG